MLVILAHEKRYLFWALYREFLEDAIEVIVDRRHQTRRREARTSSIDRRRKWIDEHLREQGWAIVGDDVTLRPRVEWILERAAMSRAPR
jgi:hypothetical protein